MKHAELENGFGIGREKTNFYTAEDISLMFTVLKDNYLHKVWLKLLFAYGLTLIELVNIKVGDIDFDNKKIKINSSKKMRHRVLSLPKCLFYELQRESVHKKPYELLFQGRTSEGKIHPRTIQKLFEKLHHHTGMEVSISKIRRSTAIHFLQSGWEEKEVTRLLGHSHLRTTRKLIGNCQKSFYKTNFPLDEILENAA